MKLITAIIKPDKLEEMHKTLRESDIRGVTVTEVRGYGRQRGHTALFRGEEYTIQYLPKIKLELAVEDSVAETVLKMISDCANTKHIGDGKIFTQALSGIYRIRTSEHGTSAL